VTSPEGAEPARQGTRGKVVVAAVAVALIGGGAAFAVMRGGGSGGSVRAFCDAAKRFQDDESLDKSSHDPAQIDKAVAALDVLVRAAPNEIKSDMELERQALAAIGAALKSAGSDPDSQFAAILAAAAGFDQVKLNRAAAHIESFGKQHCGSDFSFSNDSSSSVSSSSSSSFDSGDFSFDSSSFSSVISSFSSDINSSSSDRSSTSSVGGELGGNR